MDKLALTYRVCFRQLDENHISNFLFRQKDELLLPDKIAVDQVINLLFQRGGVMGGFDSNGNMQAILGFLFGDPAEAFQDKQTVFIYVAALSRSYRQTRIFYKGLLAVFYECSNIGIDQYKMQADLHNQYINRLYSKFGKPLGESKTLRGQPVMTYGGSIKETIARFKARDPSVAH